MSNQPLVRKAVQAKHIPDQPILDFLETHSSSVPACIFDMQGEELFPNDVQRAMPPGTPYKVALAKMRSLCKRKLVNGCTCGCRGDFVRI